MPETETMRWLKRHHIGLEPLDLRGSCAEAGTAMSQCDAGRIKHSNPRVAGVQLAVNKHGGYAADTNEPSIFFRSGCGNKRQRNLWVALIPI